MKRMLKTISAVIAAVTITMCLTYFSFADAETVSSFERLNSIVQNADMSTVEITLDDNITITEPVTPVNPFKVNSNKDIIIDLNGKTLTVPNSIVMDVDNATLTLKNGKLVSETENNAFLSVKKRCKFVYRKCADRKYGIDISNNRKFKSLCIRSISCVWH